jgi:hypothetical protein
MLDELRAGNLFFEDVYFLCLDLLEAHEVDVVLSQLPNELREQIDSRLRTAWDNDAPLENCSIFNSGSGEHPATRIIVERARRWIAQHPKRRP